MMYICIEEEIKRVQALLVDEENMIETFDWFKPKLWVKAVLYAVDGIDNARRIDGLSNPKSLESMKMYLDDSGKLPKYFELENDEELQLFQIFLKKGIYMAAVTALGAKDLGILKPYDLY